MNDQTIKRPCAVCGKSQARRRVWHKFGTGKKQKVICHECGLSYEFKSNGEIRRYGYHDIGKLINELSHAESGEVGNPFFQR